MKSLTFGLGLRLAKQHLCSCITLFCTLLCYHCTTTVWKCIKFSFYGGCKPRRNFISPSRPVRNSTPGSSLGSSFRTVRLHLLSKWVEIIAMKIRRRQIHFLAEVFTIVCRQGECLFTKRLFFPPFTRFNGILKNSLDCEQSLFSQSSLSSAGLERANWPRGKLESSPRLLVFYFRPLRSISSLAWPSWGTARSETWVKTFLSLSHLGEWGKFINPVLVLPIWANLGTRLNSVPKPSLIKCQKTAKTKRWDYKLTKMGGLSLSKQISS